jgi:hypothetical protein
MNFFGYYKKPTRTTKYNPIEYRQSSEEFFDCGDLLLEKMTEGNEFLRGRTKEDYEFLGMFFSVVLMIELKLVNLLKNFDPEIEFKMLGQKVDVFKDFLKEYVPEEEEDMNEYRNLMQPLSQIKKVRNVLAHDVKSPIFKSSDINHVVTYIKNRRPDLYEKFKDCIEDRGISIAALASFVFIFSFEIAKLRVSLA